MDKINIIEYIQNKVKTGHIKLIDEEVISQINEYVEDLQCEIQQLKIEKHELYMACMAGFFYFSQAKIIDKETDKKFRNGMGCNIKTGKNMFTSEEIREELSKIGWKIKDLISVISK